MYAPWLWTFRIVDVSDCWNLLEKFSHGVQFYNLFKKLLASDAFILVWAGRLLKERSHRSQKIFFPVNCALHFTFASPAVNIPQKGSLSPLCSLYVNCSSGRKRKKKKYKEEAISDQSYSFPRDMTYKHFWMGGCELIWFLVSEQAAGNCRAISAARTGTGGLYGFVSASFPVPAAGKGGTQDFWVQHNVSAEDLRTAYQKKGTENFSDTPSSSWWNIFLKGLLFSSLSVLHTRHICFSPYRALVLVFWKDFCLEISAILFSLVETVCATLKDQLKYNLKKNLSVLQQGLLDCGIVSQGCNGNDFPCNE